jgi:hypothetical protein
MLVNLLEFKIGSVALRTMKTLSVEPNSDRCGSFGPTARTATARPDSSHLCGDRNSSSLNVEGGANG